MERIWTPQSTSVTNLTTKTRLHYQKLNYYQTKHYEEITVDFKHCCQMGDGGTGGYVLLLIFTNCMFPNVEVAKIAFEAALA
jgi:hypothetical protein